jgi:hypothetical protein
MPSVAEVKSLKIGDEILKSLIEKLKKAINEENISELWEKELKGEAKRIFTLLPIETYENSVFKELELMTSKNGQGGEVKKQHNSKSFSRGSLRKSLSGSGSSFTNKLRSISFVDSQTENKVNQEKPLIVFKCFY